MLNLILTYRYIIIVPIALFEGPLIMMLGGFLWRLGLFDFLPLYLALMLGDLLGDIFWYWLGHNFGHRFVRRFGHFFSITENAIATAERIFHQYKNKILTISKLTMGLGFAPVILFTAGLVKIPFRRYLALNVFGQFFWTAFLMVIGYYLGEGYARVNNWLGKISFIAIMILIFLILLGFSKYLKGRIVKKYS
ncbi:MAG TPA: DedA family protein [Candidatus Paceibacterota bacterium]|nr:DedA family protein [Candidatus Paceibacterota bacterium]